MASSGDSCISPGLPRRDGYLWWIQSPGWFLEDWIPKFKDISSFRGRPNYTKWIGYRMEDFVLIVVAGVSLLQVCKLWFDLVSGPHLGHCEHAAAEGLLTVRSLRCNWGQVALIIGMRGSSTWHASKPPTKSIITMDCQCGLKRFGQALHLLSVGTDLCRLIRMLLSAHISNNQRILQIFCSELVLFPR